MFAQNFFLGFALVSIFISFVARAETRSFDFDAFVDLETRFSNKDSLADRGFTLNDASLEISKDLGRGRFFVELPFSSNLTGASDGFSFAAQSAQAYVYLERAPVFLKLGQYDSFLGVERNTSKDRFFANWGMIREHVLPETHAGVQISLGTRSTAFFVQVANPNGQSAMARENPEGGGGLRFEAGPAYGALGATMGDSKSVVTGNKTTSIMEAKFGVNAGGFQFDGDVGAKRSAGSEKTAGFYGLLMSLSLSEVWAVGLRGEYLRDIYVTTTTGAGTYDSISSGSLGASYRFQPDLLMRGDFTFTDQKTTGAEETFSIFTLSMVADF